MSRTEIVINCFNSFYEMGRKQVVENRRLALVTTAVSGAFILLTALYQRLHRPDALPFDRLGLWPRPHLTEDLDTASKKHPPAELARRLYNDQTPIAEGTDKILPSYRQGCPITVEDQNAYAIQTRIMSLQPLLAFIKDKPLPWGELLRPIQSSPRFAYTILFNCMAPFAAKAMWEGGRDFLPKFLHETTTNYLQHKGKIALASLTLIAWLYYRMNQEKGIITNWTTNLSLSPSSHRGIYCIPSYENAIKELLRRINISEPGTNAANIIWYYNEYTHSTFVGEIGAILGEMTAAGKGGPKLEIIELDVRRFLAAYLDPVAVSEGWYNLLTKLAKNDRALVVLTDIDMIKPYLIPCPKTQKPEEGRPNTPSHPCAETFASLVLIALRQKQGKFRCLIELSEDEWTMMKNSAQTSCLFSPIKAPDISPKELEDLCVRLYTAPEVLGSFTQEDIRKLFVHMKRALAAKPIPPLDIMNAIQDGLRDRASSKSAEAIRGVKPLQEIQKMKDDILQKLWQQRRQNKPDSPVLLRGLSLLETELLPLYKKAMQTPSEPSNLISQMQERFSRLFGKATPQEVQRLHELPGQLREKIKGQDVAIEAICHAIEQWRTVPRRNGKPLVLLFAGASGVGKSETATQIARHVNYIYGIVNTKEENQETNMKQVHLNREDPGGLFGWEKVKGSIMNPLLHTPTIVMILEEWDKMEKGRSSLLELLDGTQIHSHEYWDDASRNGPLVAKSSAIFILTANIKMGDTSGTPTERVKAGIRALFPAEKDLPPEQQTTANAFLSRIDFVIPFEGIGKTAAAEVVKKELDEYEQDQVLDPRHRPAVEERLRDINPQDVRELERLIEQAIFEVQKAGRDEEKRN